LGYKLTPRSESDLLSPDIFEKAESELCGRFWAVGVGVEINSGSESNRYYRRGKEISRREAFQIAAKANGKPMPNIP